MKKIENIQQAENILNLWLEGESSLQQEEMLREFLLSSEPKSLTTELKNALPVFCYLSEEKNAIDELKAENIEFPSKRKNLIINFASIIVAASVIIALCLFSPSPKDITPTESPVIRLVVNGEEVEDNEKAVAIADAQLAKISTAFSKLKKDLPSDNKFEKMNNTLKKTGDIINRINIK